MVQAERFIDELRERLGRRATVRAVDPAGLASLDADYVVLTMDAGDFYQAREMAIAANLAFERNPEVRFLLSLGGCDNDDREIDQIPAARVTLRTLHHYLEQETFWRLEVESQAICLVAAGLGKRHGTKLCVPADKIRRP